MHSRCFCYSSQVTPAILRLPQLFDNGPYLLWRKLLAGSLVTRLQELIPEWGAAANPNHQVIDGGTRIALGKIHQSQFLLGVRTNDKIFHITKIFIRHFL